MSKACDLLIIDGVSHGAHNGARRGSRLGVVLNGVRQHSGQGSWVNSYAAGGGNLRRVAGLDRVAIGGIHQLQLNLGG